MEDKPMSKAQKAQVRTGLRLVAVGVILILLPVILVSLDAAFSISEGANIGAALLGLLTFPAGLILLIMGLLKIAIKPPKK